MLSSRDTPVFKTQEEDLWYLSENVKYIVEAVTKQNCILKDKCLSSDFHN